METVLQIDSDDSRPNDFGDMGLDLSGALAVTGFDIRGHGNLRRPHEFAASPRHDLRPRCDFPVRIAERPGDATARRREHLESGIDK